MATEQLFADRYRLDRRLGVGGMATVQLAFDTRLERNVAVKLLAEHLAEDASFISRFRREALAAAKLVHPNIVQVFDFGTDQGSGRQFIVMEFVDGNSCAELLRDRGPMTPRDAVDILTQACRGLDYAHRNGVVHRDVKPGNLMVNTDGVVKLADFGIAKAAEQSDITKVGSVLGTAAYLSPEQARGEPAGPPSDLYALGVVSYQLMAGKPALRGGVADRPGATPGGRSAAAAGRDQPRRAADVGQRGRPRAGTRSSPPLRRTRPRWRTRCTTASPGSAGTGRLERDARAAHRRRHADARPPATAATPRPRRRLQPVEEPPRRAPAPPRRAPAQPPRREGSGAGKWVALVLVILISPAAATPTRRWTAAAAEPSHSSTRGHGHGRRGRRQLQAGRARTTPGEPSRRLTGPGPVRFAATRT